MDREYTTGAEQILEFVGTAYFTFFSWMPAPLQGVGYFAYPMTLFGLSMVFVVFMAALLSGQWIGPMFDGLRNI